MEEGAVGGRDPSDNNSDSGNGSGPPSLDSEGDERVPRWMFQPVDNDEEFPNLLQHIDGHQAIGEVDDNQNRPDLHQMLDGGPQVANLVADSLPDPKVNVVMQCNGGLTYRSLYNALVRAGLGGTTHKAEISENRHIYRLPESDVETMRQVAENSNGDYTYLDYDDDMLEDHVLMTAIVEVPANINYICEEADLLSYLKASLSTVFGNLSTQQLRQRSEIQPGLIPFGSREIHLHLTLLELEHFRVQYVIQDIQHSAFDANEPSVSMRVKLDICYGCRSPLCYVNNLDVRSEEMEREEPATANSRSEGGMRGASGTDQQTTEDDVNELADQLSLDTVFLEKPVADPGDDNSHSISQKIATAIDSLMSVSPDHDKENHRIFFEEPPDILQEIIREEPLAPEHVVALYPYVSHYILPYNQDVIKRHALIYYTTTDRVGATEEAENLADAFMVAGFITTARKLDKIDQLQLLLDRDLQEVFEKCSMLVISVMSHGNYGHLIGDGFLPISDFLKQLTDNIPNHIPMVVIIQSCQLFHHQELELETLKCATDPAVASKCFGSDKHIILTRPHTLLLIATVAGGNAYRGAYTGALANQIRNADGVTEIHQMHVLACLEISRTNDYTQIPELRSTMMRNLILPPCIERKEEEDVRVQTKPHGIMYPDLLQIDSLLNHLI